jgi:antitoxin Phd
MYISEGLKMNRITVTQARARIGEVLQEAENQPVAVQRRGKEDVYIIGREDYELLAKAKAKARIQNKHAGTVRDLADR